MSHRDAAGTAEIAVQAPTLQPQPYGVAQERTSGRLVRPPAAEFTTSSALTAPQGPPHVCLTSAAPDPKVAYQPAT